MFETAAAKRERRQARRRELRQLKKQGLPLKPGPKPGNFAAAPWSAPKPPQGRLARIIRARALADGREI